MAPTPKDFAQISAFMGWDRDECIKALVEDHELSEEDARECANDAYRERQDVDIEDTHDEIMEDHQ